MTIPRFTAEASLAPTRGHYRANIALGGSPEPNISPMQQAIAALPPKPLKRVPCCHNYFGKPLCTYYWVPAWFTCEPIWFDPICYVCYPLIPSFGDFTS
jgi:hypothetical protein